MFTLYHPLADRRDTELFKRNRFTARPRLTVIKRMLYIESIHCFASPHRDINNIYLFVNLFIKIFIHPVI